MTISLSSLGTSSKTAIDASNAILETALGTLGADATAGELVAFQVELTKNSVLVAARSAVVKDLGDMYKGVIQKFS